MWTNPCADSIHPHSTKHFIIRKFGQFLVKIAAMIKAFTTLTTLSNIVFAKLSDSCEVTAFHILFFLSFSNSRFINFSATMECASHWKRGDRFVILTYMVVSDFLLNLKKANVHNQKVRWQAWLWRQRGRTSNLFQQSKCASDSFKCSFKRSKIFLLMFLR